MSRRRFVHILDDMELGGVTRALRNFQHPILQEFGYHETVDIRTGAVRASKPSDIAIIHFTSNWWKLPQLLKLRTQGRFSRLILIEHTYTDGFEKSEVRSHARFRNMLRCAYRLVDTVVAVSNAQKQWMLDAGLAAPDKIVSIPQSRDCSDLLTLPLPEDRSGPIMIGAFGRFHRQKGFDLLLEAMAKIDPQTAKLKLAGTGPERLRLQGMADKLPHVDICKPFNCPLEFLKNIDLVAIPSRWEAFGLVGTEARTAGRPILASRIDGLHDQLVHGGYSHEPADVASIAYGIRRAASAPSLSALGTSARREAAGEYDRMINGWAKLLSISSSLAMEAA
ncbi:MAG: glycosyltransferase family 4 protein [Pseudomonadota bacterium]